MPSLPRCGPVTFNALGRPPTLSVIDDRLEKLAVNGQIMVQSIERFEPQVPLGAGTLAKLY